MSTAPVVRNDTYSFQKTTTGGVTRLTIRGTLSDAFEGRKLAAAIKTRVVMLDMRDVVRFASWGMSEWMDFLRCTQERENDVYIVDCSMYACSQLHIVTGLMGRAKLVSFFASYRCAMCSEEIQSLFVIPRDRAAIRSIPGSTRDCPKCGHQAKLEEYPAALFEMIAGRPAFEIDDDALAFMRTQLGYDLAPDVTRFRAFRRTAKDYTYLRLSGDIATLPHETLAPMTIGTTLVQLDGIRSDPTQLGPWRNYLDLALPKAKSIQLVDCPVGFLEGGVSEEHLRRNLRVRTFTVNYACGACGAKADKVVDVAENLEDLVKGVLPAMRCPSCRLNLTAQTTPALLDVVRALPARDRDPALDAFLGKSRELPTEKLENCLLAPKSVATAQPRSRNALYAAIGAGVVGAAAITLIATRPWRDDAQPPPKGSGESGSAVVPVQPQGPTFTRPEWITSDVAGSGYCRDLINRLMCVGVSSFVVNKDQGLDEASHAALEELTSAIGLKVPDPYFKNSVVPAYADARTKALAAMQLAEINRGRDPAADLAYVTATDAVRSARKRVVEVLRTTGGVAVPAQRSDWYWEEYTKDVGEGTEFLVFARFDISLDAVKALVDTYSTPTTVLGSAVTTTFPELAWSRDQVTGGVFVVKPGGALAKEGVKMGDVILEVDAERVGDAIAFSKRVTGAKSDLKLTVLSGNAKSDIKVDR
jgi:DNA-directed RNA polymerase subunit RPC12/RpoP